MSVRPEAEAETPFFVEGSAGHLFGVITDPSDGPSSHGVVLCSGGWMGGSSSRNRLLVRAARQLAVAGYVAARFDWPGVGESSGNLDSFTIDRPFSDEVAAVADLLRQRGADGITLVGICFGARSALAAAERIPEVRRLVLMNFPSPVHKTKSQYRIDRLGWRQLIRMGLRRSTLAGLSDPQLRRAVARGLARKIKSVVGTPAPQRVGPSVDNAQSMADTTRHLIKRGTSIRLIFGEEDLEREAFRQFIITHGIAELPFEIILVPGDISSFGTLSAQESVVRIVVESVAAGQ